VYSYGPCRSTRRSVGLFVTLMLTIRLRAWRRITKPESSLKEMVRTTTDR
jgi:hypothetical protein